MIQLSHFYWKLRMKVPQKVKRELTDLFESFIIPAVSLALVISLSIGFLFGGWYFFFGYHDYHPATVIDDNGVYKMWSITNYVDTYTEECTGYGRNVSCDSAWRVIRSNQTSGNSDNPIVTPPPIEYKQCQYVVSDAGCERVRTEEHYNVLLHTDEKNIWCNISKALWGDGFPLGSTWMIDKNRWNGYLCYTLRKSNE